MAKPGVYFADHSGCNKSCGIEYLEYVVAYTTALCGLAGLALAIEYSQLQNRWLKR